MWDVVGVGRSRMAAPRAFDVSRLRPQKGHCRFERASDPVTSFQADLFMMTLAPRALPWAGLLSPYRGKTVGLSSEDEPRLG
jgi:hypothetical protein